MKNTTSSSFFKQKREQKGLTQEEVARHLGYTSKQIVSNWERGLCTPPLAALSRLSKLLNISKSDVIEVFLAETEASIERQFTAKRNKARAKSA